MSYLVVLIHFLNQLILLTTIPALCIFEQERCTSQPKHLRSLISVIDALHLGSPYFKFLYEPRHEKNGFAYAKTKTQISAFVFAT